jgi:UDP-N-acetyl-D-glucosamine dehydrogenase
MKDLTCVGIIGQGYVGSALAMAVTSAGYQVVGYDIDKEIVKGLQGKKLSNYLATNNPSDLAGCRIVVIAVPTPLGDDRSPDLSYLNLAVELIIKHIDNPTLIINESTSYPGTLRNEIASVIDASQTVKHLYASAPERVDPSNESWNLKNTPRLISGLSEEATIEALNFYQSFTDNVKVVSSPEIAEAAKLFENTFRQVNIALVNEFAKLTRLVGLDVNEILEAAATKPFGFLKFNPGPGVGGHCIPIDPLYLNYYAEKNNFEIKLISLADEINLQMPEYIVSIIKKDHDNQLIGKKIIVIGLAYKANTADTRESPSISIIKLLRTEGAEVCWSDDLVKIWNNETSVEIGKQDIAIIVTKHNYLDSDELKQIPYVFDCTSKVGFARKL